MLNWRCNLRCPMCMQWGDTGWMKKQPEESHLELDWATVRKVFDAASSFNASFVLSGGEPLLYHRFRDLLLLLKERRRYAIICTNGLFLNRYLDQLDGNRYPTLLISLDGFEDETDRLRGTGVFAKVMKNIELLKDLRKPPFIGVQFTIMPENVARMEDFCEEMVGKGVDWMLLNPGWFLSKDQASHYEEFMEKRFGIHPASHLGYLRSYDYDADALRAQLERIRSREWPIQISSYLREPEWVYDFLGSPEKILGNRLCYKQWLRLDVLPDSRVAPCVQFPDLTVGDLNVHTVREVWHGIPNRRFQRVVSDEPLPICSKCNNIYLYSGGG